MRFARNVLRRLRIRTRGLILDFEPCWPVFRKYLGAASPAATMFVAGLLDDNMKLEIEVTARVASVQQSQARDAKDARMLAALCAQ